MTQDEQALQQQKIAFLEGRRALYAKVAGGWPPTVVDQAQLAEIRSLLLKDIGHARSFVAESPDNQHGREIYADLLRMAHNLDVPDAARQADAVLRNILAHDPDSYAAHLSLASLYITLQPELAAEAARHFQRALELRPEIPDPAIYQGLGFASLHQGQVAGAIENFQKYLSLVPTDKRIAEFAERLSKGEVPTRIQAPPAENTAPVESAVPAEKERKSWWKRW